MKIIILFKTIRKRSLMKTEMRQNAWKETNIRVIHMTCHKQCIKGKNIT